MRELSLNPTEIAERDRRWWEKRFPGLFPVDMTPRTAVVLRCSVHNASRFNHEIVKPAHLLAGILQEGASIAAQICKRHGISLLSVRVGIEEMIPPGPDINYKVFIDPKMENAFSTLVVKLVTPEVLLDIAIRDYDVLRILTPEVALDLQDELRNLE